MHINELFKTKKAHFIAEFIFYSIYWTFKYPVNWKTNSRSFALINFKASATATFIKGSTHQGLYGHDIYMKQDMLP